MLTKRGVPVIVQRHQSEEPYWIDSWAGWLVDVSIKNSDERWLALVECAVGSLEVVIIHDGIRIKVCRGNRDLIHHTKMVNDERAGYEGA